MQRAVAWLRNGSQRLHAVGARGDTQRAVAWLRNGSQRVHVAPRWL